MNNNGFFSHKKRLNNSTKNFIVAFGVFILILGVSSVLLFMYSLDFDIHNLVETTTEQTEPSTEQTDDVYSVDTLNGKSNIMFVFLNDKSNVEFICCSMIDYDNKSFKIGQINGDSQINVGDCYKSVNGIYTDNGINGIKDLILDRYGVSVDKYAVFNKSDLKQFLLAYDGFTVNVTESIDYTSPEFDIELEVGVQTLSAEKTINYLYACDGSARESALCDVAVSILKPQYISYADSLFKKFVNASKTDISVIDFSNAFDALETYCLADDKFAPISYSDGE